MPPSQPGEPAVEAPAAGCPEVGRWPSRHATHYQRALQAQRDGNWALYGEEIKKLGEVLEKMRR